MSEYGIRPAENGDAEAIARIIIDTEWFDFFKKAPYDEAVERVGRHLAMCLADPQCSVRVATGADGAVAGYVSVHWNACLMFPAPEGYVAELFVAAGARGKGVGAMLLDHAACEGRERGCYRMMLLNGRNRESYARSFYAKQGWFERDEMSNFILYL